MPLDRNQRRFFAFLFRHGLLGTVSGFVFGGLVLALDIGGLGTLIAASAERELFLLMLFFGLFVTFGGIGIAIGVMELGEERD